MRDDRKLGMLGILDKPQGTAAHDCSGSSKLSPTELASERLRPEDDETNLCQLCTACKNVKKIYNSPESNRVLADGNG